LQASAGREGSVPTINVTEDAALKIMMINGAPVRFVSSGNDAPLWYGFIYLA